MVKFVKFVVLCVLALIGAGIVYNAMIYFGFGGLKGGFVGIGLAALAHLVGVVAVGFGAVAVWKFNLEKL